MNPTVIPGRVSVVVPCYNRKKYIKKCLKSLAAQTYKNLEIIIVDDGSSDKTPKVIKKWIRAQKKRIRKRVVFFRLPRNTGNAGAYTTGMHLARGEFIALQDSDDYSHPKRLQRQVEYLRRHPQIGMVGTRYAWFRKKKKPRTRGTGWLRYHPKEIEEKYKKGHHCVCVATVMFRKHCFDQFGGFHRGINKAEDYRFIVKYFQNGVKIGAIPKVLYYYRSHSGQRSRVNRKR